MSSFVSKELSQERNPKNFEYDSYDSEDSDRDKLKKDKKAPAGK